MTLPWSLSKIITDKTRGFACWTIPSTSRYSRYGRNQTVHMISKITSWKIKTYIYISMLWFWFHTIWRLIFLNAIPNFIYLVTYQQWRSPNLQPCNYYIHQLPNQIEFLHRDNLSYPHQRMVQHEILTEVLKSAYISYLVHVFAWTLF